MFAGHSVAVRVLSLAVIGGVITTGITFYLRKNRKDRNNFLSHRSARSQSDYDEINHIEDNSPRNKQKTEEENDFPPDFRVIIHGGAGVVSKGIDSKPFFDALTRIMADAYKFAKNGGDNVTALDLAEYCVKQLEDDILFNAGRGAVFTNYETIEMEASIMDGRTLECGAVSLIKTVKHPISLARAVMEHTRHNHLIGKAAEKLAAKCSLDIVDPSYFSTPKRREQLKRAKEMGDAIVNDHDYEDDNDDDDDNDNPLKDTDTDFVMKLNSRNCSIDKGQNGQNEESSNIDNEHLINNLDNNKNDNNNDNYDNKNISPNTNNDSGKNKQRNNSYTQKIFEGDFYPEEHSLLAEHSLLGEEHSSRSQYSPELNNSPSNLTETEDCYDSSECDHINNLNNKDNKKIKSKKITSKSEKEQKPEKTKEEIVANLSKNSKNKKYSFDTISEKTEHNKDHNKDINKDKDNNDKDVKSKNYLEREREREKEKILEVFYPGSTGTVGCVCMIGGHVAAATSTGGLTNKMAGRVGDTSIIGAGTYANDKTCAISATGKGEDFMRHVAAYDVAARMEIGQMTLKNAVRDTVFKKLPAESGGIIAIESSGEYSMQFNSKGMFRAVCDSSGQCSVGIWEDMIPFYITPQGRASIIVTGYSEKVEVTESYQDNKDNQMLGNRRDILNKQ